MNGVVIVAAGTGSRMNMGINKQFIKLEGKEIIAYTIEKFYNNSNIEDIVVVVKEDESEFFKKEILDKVIDNDKNIVDTPNRSVLWAVQTPQTFYYNILIDAYKDAFKNKFYGTDDAMLVERIGYKVKMLEGSYNNIKITTQEDLNIGSQILRVQD